MHCVPCFIIFLFIYRPLHDTVYHLGPYSRTNYDIGFESVEMAFSINPKPMIYRNLHENTGPASYLRISEDIYIMCTANIFVRYTQNVQLYDTLYCDQW